MTATATARTQARDGGPCGDCVTGRCRVMTPPKRSWAASRGWTGKQASIFIDREEILQSLGPRGWELGTGDLLDPLLPFIDRAKRVGSGPVVG